MSFPTPHTVLVKRYRTDVRDSHGNRVDAWADGVPLAVHFIAPGVITETERNDRDLTSVAYTIGCPEGPGVPGALDRVVVAGVEYRVDGDPKDWTRGPWPFPGAGVTFELGRVEG